MAFVKPKRRFAVPCPGCRFGGPSRKPNRTNSSASGAPAAVQTNTWSNSMHHLCAAVQLDILLCAEEDAGSLSHSGILLPRRIVRQQHAGNRRGADGYL